MKDYTLISDTKIEKLAKKLARTLSIDLDEAIGLVYKEWDLVENLFNTHGKVKSVHQHFINELNYTNRIM